MNESLTIVLPLHNAEKTIRKDIVRSLEAASELTSLVELMLVDDASTDDTFDMACELATEFPQVRVLRRSRKGGLAEALEQIKRTVTSDIVIIHDGQSRVNAEQICRIWTQQRMMGALNSGATEGRPVSFADLRRPAITQPLMAEAHRRLLGFQRLESASAPVASDEAALQRHDSVGESKPASRKGVGAIPSLPRPNLFGVISDFARGE